MPLRSMLLDVDDGVATITLNRPEHRNTMTGDVVTEMHAILEDLARRRDVRVVVLTAVGDRFFCPGADLDPAASDPGASLPDAGVLHSAVLFHEMPQVTLAAINGACAGAGLGWAAACDLRVSTSSAIFNVAFLDVGVAGDMGVPWTLGHIVGPARARELSFLRGKFDAAAALRMGLVSEVFAPEDFASGVGGVVQRLRSAPPRALAMMKANYVAAERMGLADFVDLETSRHFHLISGTEFHAGAEAFRRRSAPGSSGEAVGSPDTGD